MKNYTYHIDLDFEDFSDWDLFNFKNNKYGFGETIGDSIFDWESPVYYDTDYFIDEYKGIAIEYLKNKGFTDNEISDIGEELDNCVLSSCDGSWRDSVESGIFELYEEKATNPGFDYSNMAYIDSAGKETEYLWEAVSIRYFFSERFWRENIYREDWYETIADARDSAEDDILEYCMDNLEKLTTGNYGDFERVQDNYTIKEIDFLNRFSDSEALYTIEKNRSDKLARLKNLIRAHVPLNKRAQILSIGV